MNSKSVKEGGKHNMYSKSKRFIASFLAVLMAVCMLPADMLGGIATVHAAATLTATFVEDSSAVAATNNVDSGTAVSISATDTDSEGITHIVWSTSSDLTSMDNDAILAAWSDLSKKEGLASDSIEISGTAGATVTLTAAAVKYTPAVEADAENNIEAADAAVVKSVDESYAFTINAAKTNLSGATIELSSDTVVAGNDMPTVESVKVTVDGSEQTLTENVDYEVEYSVDGTTKSAAELKALTVTENTTVTVTVKAKSDSATYTGNKTATFTITPQQTVTVTAPTATPDAGEVTTGTTVALSAGSGADIYYVTKTAAEVGADGFTAPTAAEITGSEDNKYTTAIPVSAAMTIYAVAKVGTDLSSVASYAYTIKAAGEANPFDLVLDFSSSSYGASDNTLPPYNDGYFSFTHDKTKTIQSKTFKVDTNNTYKTAGGSYTYYNIGGNTTGNNNVKRAVKFTLSSEAEVIIGGSAGSAASTETPRRFGLLNDDRSALLSDATQVNCAASNTIYELKLTDLEVGKEYAVGSPDTIYLNYIVVKEKDYQPTKDTIIASEPAGPIQAGTKVTFKAPVGVDIYLAEGETVTTDAANKYDGAEIEITATKKITVVAKAGNAVSAPETYEYTIAQPIAVAPEASVQSGVYTEAQSVTLSSTTADATIYYTTDGKNPVGNANAQATTGAITVDKTQTIKAYAKSDATQASDVVTLTYIIKTNANKTYTMDPAEEDAKNAPDVDEEGYGDFLSVGSDGYFRLVGIKAKSPVISPIGEVKGTVNGVSNTPNYTPESMTGWPTEAGELTTDSKVLVLTGGQIKVENGSVINALRFDASAKAKVTVYYAVKNGTATKIQVYKASKYDDSALGTAVTITAPDSKNTEVAKAEFEVAEAGSYYIGFAASGGIIPYMTVEENPSTITPPEDTVAITPTISADDLAKVTAAGAALYFVADDDSEVEFPATGAAQLKKNTTYHIVAKKGTTVDDTITVKIDGEDTFAVADAAANITVTVEVEAQTIDAPTFDPAAEAGTDPASYTFPSKTGKVEIKLTKAAQVDGAEIYYVLSTETDKYDTFEDDAAVSVYKAGTLYEGAINVTAEVTIKAVAVKDDKASKVVTSPIYKVGTLDTLKGEITADPEEGSEYEAGAEVKVTLAYEKDEAETVDAANVKYLYKIGTDAPQISIAADGTETKDGDVYTDGIALDTTEEGEICIKVLAYTVDNDNKVTAVSGVSTFTYTVNPAAPTPHAITVDTSETNAKVTVPADAIKEAIVDDIVYISNVASVSEIKEGYRLNGWKVTTATNKPVDVESDYDYYSDDLYYYFTMPDEAVTVKADIVAKADCTVKLYKEDGTTQVGETKTLKEGDKYTFPAEVPTNEDTTKYFKGWKNKNGTETYNPKDEIEVTENLEFVETWAAKATGEDGKPKTFTVTFKNYDGDVIEKLTKTEQESGAVIDIPSEPVSKRTGYIFLGWSMDEENGDYASVYEGNTYIVTNYNVTFKERFDYEELKYSGMEVRIDDDETYYTGKAVLPYVAVYYNGSLLTPGTDYTIKGKNNVNADGKKQPTFTITGKNNYAKANRKDVPFVIKKANIADCTYSTEMTVVQGASVSPLIIFDETGKALKLKKDFSITGANLNSKGKYDNATAEPEYDETTGVLKNEDKAFNKLTVTGINNFKGNFDINVRVISKEAAKNAKLGVEIERGWKPTYDDETIKGCNYFKDLFTGKYETNQDGSVKIDETTKKPVIKEGTRKINVYAKSDRSKTPLTYGEDYTVLVNSGYYRSAGTVKFTIVGMGKYTGNVSKSLKILPKKLESADLVYGIFDKREIKDGIETPVMKENPSVEYDPTGTTPSISVYKKVTTKVGDKDVTSYQPLYEYDNYWKEGDYKVTYSGNKKVNGKAKAKITFIGDYKGTKPVTVQFAITALPLQLTDEYGEGITVAAPDMVFSKAGKSYKAKPVVYYSYYDYNEEYESERLVTTQLKSSDYTLSYEWASASKITVTDGKESGYTDPDNGKVKVAIDDKDNCAVVRIKVTLKGNYTTARKAATTGQDGKPVEGEELTVYGYYRVWKSTAAKYDLSKAKVEFFKEYDNGEYKTPYKKGINFNNQELYTPAAKYDEKTQKVIYEKPDEEEYRQPVYVKVTVNKTEVVPANLFDVQWYNSYGKGKANVIVTGKGTTPTTPSTTPNAPSAQADNETGTGSEGGTTEPTKPAVPDYAVGSKNASIKINPIGSWIEPAKDGSNTIAGILKKVF